MEYKYIIKTPQKTHRLIIIFAGWSTRPDFYRNLQADGWDIVVVYDYSTLDLDLSFMEGYSTVFVIAWSLGVAAASHLATSPLFAERISAAFAVNGTIYPSDDLYGIPTNIYESTRAGLNARNLLKFTKRMGCTVSKDGISLSVTISAEAATSPAEETFIPDFDKMAWELENIRDNATRGNLPWKRAYISDADRIFPPANMSRYWSEYQPVTQIVNIQAPHYVNLQNVIEDVTPNYSKIAGRFRKALPTYDDNASAQRIIVDTLIGMFPQADIVKGARLLEIGSGSGLLTRVLGKALHPSQATFIDLYPTPTFGIAPDEKYIVGDAEKYIREFDDNQFEVIASASTIQWFADPDSFFRLSARILTPDGILLCSSFLPGNLAELDNSRPAPLLYRSEEELRDMLGKYFNNIEIKSAPIVLHFPTRRQLMMHLKLTGVGGGGTSRENIVKQSYSNTPQSSISAPNDFTLTYSPVYIIASSPRK